MDKTGDEDEFDEDELSICDCGHPRRRHNNGEFECRRCPCRGFHHTPIPDLFEDLPDADADPN